MKWFWIYVLYEASRGGQPAQPATPIPVAVQLTFAAVALLLTLVVIISTLYENPVPTDDRDDIDVR